jgi:hypothetical protein
LNEQKEATSCKISPLERSEKDSALQSRNSAEKGIVLPKRNSGGKKRKEAGPKAYSVLKCLIY